MTAKIGNFELCWRSLTFVAVVLWMKYYKQSIFLSKLGHSGNFQSRPVWDALVECLTLNNLYTEPELHILTYIALEIRLVSVLTIYFLSDFRHIPEIALPSSLVFIDEKSLCAPFYLLRTKQVIFGTYFNECTEFWTLIWLDRDWWWPQALWRSVRVPFLLFSACVLSKLFSLLKALSKTSSTCCESIRITGPRN